MFEFWSNLQSQRKSTLSEYYRDLSKKEPFFEWVTVYLVYNFQFLFLELT